MSLLTSSRRGARANSPFHICRAGLSLAIALFAIESSASHLLSALGYGDTRLTWPLWWQHLAIYLCAGLLAAAGPALASGMIASERGRSYCRALLPAILLVIYVVVLQIRGPREWMPLVSPALLAVVTLSAITARFATSFREVTHNRSIAFTSGYITWAALFYVSLGPLVASHLSKGSLTSTYHVTLNVLIPAVCLVAATVVAWQASAVTPGTDVNRLRRRIAAIAVSIGAACYGVLAIAAVQGDITWLRARHASPSRNAGSRPLDLVVVLVDSLRADRLGAYGYPHSRTPHLDRLAARSVVYADHVAVSPWTYPSFATLLTSRSPTVHGARRLSWPRDPGQQPGIPELGLMRADLPTLATILKKQGYETAFIGTNWLLSRAYGFTRGFDFYSNPLTTDLYVTLGTLLREPYPWSQTIDAAEMTERFLWYLDRRRDHPVALVAHYMDPHVPYTPPRRFRERTEDSSGHAGATPLEMMSADLASSLYDGEVSYVDEQFGRLWHYLERAGRIGRTVIAVTSDHGEMLHLRRPPSPWPLADSFAYRAVDHGHNLYQDLLHTPFIVYTPTVRPRVEKHMTRAVDVLPTLLGALNVEIPAGLEGRSVLDPVVMELPGLSESVLYGLEKKSWREGRYKLIHRSHYPERQEFELYDLAVDPRELRDLVEEQPERVREMAGRLRDYLSGLSTAHPSVAPIDRETIERLRSLGYVK